ncbi:MAG: MucR family transcriptional regulator [Bacteroidales bacterium]|nr:MucR family transcriptional regulator [Bacteroidales bacterium]
MCQSCYNYFRKGGIVNPLPEHGRIRYDATGKVICHICGRAYTRLGSHVKESHDMTIKEYKEKFGLCKRTKTTERCYSQAMRNYAKNNGMDERLIKVGRNTRIQNGQVDMRKGKKVCLQEILDKRDRKFK